jgi:DNA-binding beta-propeller fold protein YncE
MREILFAIAVTALTGLHTQSREPLSLVHTIPLPNVEGRFDHFAFDATTNRLFVTALGNNTVEVLDLNASTRVKSLGGFREPQGIAAVPDARLIVVANGQGEGVQLVRADDLQSGGAIRLGDDADNVRYDGVAKRVYVGYGSGAIAAVSLSDIKVLGQTKLAGHPESFQLEGSGQRMFVNVPAAGHVAVIDRTTMKLVTSWPVTGARSNFPMALDEPGHRLFIGCRSPARVVMFDTTTGKEIGGFDAVGDTDDLFYDQSRKRLYVSGGEGFLDVFQIEDGARATRLAHVATAAGARTSFFLPDRNRLFLAVPHRGSQQAEIRVYQVR